MKHLSRLGKEILARKRPFVSVGATRWLIAGQGPLYIAGKMLVCGLSGWLNAGERAGCASKNDLGKNDILQGSFLSLLESGLSLEGFRTGCEEPSTG